MFVAVGRLSFRLEGVYTLKEKRSVVKKMVERTKAKFNVAIAEVGENDTLGGAILGISVVGNTGAHVNSMITKVMKFVERLELGEYMGSETEIIPMGANFSGDLENFDVEFSLEEFDEQR